MAERLTVNKQFFFGEALSRKALIRILVRHDRVVGFIKVEINYSPVAQLVEQMTVNHRVRGSSPRRGATILKRPSFEGLFFGVDGSRMSAFPKSGRSEC